MSQNERLRALLEEALDWMIDDTCYDCERGGCELRKRIRAALAEPGDVHPSNLTDVVTLLENDRAEVERLKALGAVLSADIQRLTSRVAQSDADWAALRAEAATAYRRGAEAMREAAARFFADQQLYLNAKDIKNLPIPEDKP